MLTQCLPGILIPFAGTTLGSACVFFMKKTLHEGVQRALTGFAAGVMVAASIWSLLIPAMEQSKGLGRLAFIPATVGFWLGIGFLLLLDMAVPHLHQGADTPEGPHSGFSRTTMLVLAVTLHNVPEGLAVGLAFGLAGNSSAMPLSGALALSLGMALQNFPEGAAISLPLKKEGLSNTRSFVYGALSGIVEPIAGVLGVLAAGTITGVMPWLLAFAAGAMIYVVVEELIPEASLGEHSHTGTLSVMLGFLVMMVLDVALG